MNERRTFLQKASLMPLGLAITEAAQALPQERGEEMIPPEQAHQPSSSQEEPPPPQEVPFSEYHLKGTPDTEGNLTGTAPRTPDWKQNKVRVENELQRLLANDPIVDWMKTFLPMFGERATTIVLNAVNSLYRTDMPAGKPPELRYEPELYDAMLRSAAIQLDRCLRYRNEMGGFEVTGIGAGVAYLTFLKIKPLQRNLIRQSSFADIDEIVKNTEERTRQIYASAHGLGRVFEKYQLLGLRAESYGEVIEAGHSELKEKLRTSLLERQFNIQTDAQLTEFTRLLTPGSASNYAERYLRLLTFLTEDLTDAYCKLYSASVGVQQVLQLTGTVLSGDGTAVPVGMPKFANAAGIANWIPTVAPSGGQQQPDVLDGLVLWSRAIMRELDRRSQYESEFTVAIPLSQPAGSKTKPLVTVGQVQSGTVSFSLDTTVLPFSSLPAALRVVGVGLSVERGPDDLSPLQYTTGFPHTPSNPVVGLGQTPAPGQEPTPQQVSAAQTFEAARMARLNATVTSPPQQYPGATNTYQRPPILLPSVRIQGGGGGDLEPRLSFSPACHNILPFGPWTIQIDPNAIEYYQSNGTISANWLTGLVFYLRLRGTAA
jgi:hypothetical protein